MAEVTVLIEGENTRDKENKMSMGSSVTLIKSDRIILVDTGSIPAKDRLIQELEKQGLTPEDIDIVVLTHLHLDHAEPHDRVHADRSAGRGVGDRLVGR